MDRSIYDSALDFFFNEAPAVLGERGTLSSTTSALERGNASSGLYEEPLARLESHAYRHWSEQMRLERETRARFSMLTGLMVRLEPKPDGYDETLAAIQARALSGEATKDDLDAIKAEKALWVNAQALLGAQYSTTARRVLHLEAVFGEIVGAIVFLVADRDLSKMKMKEVAKLERHAFFGVREAHKAWRATNPKKKVKDGPRLEVPEEAPLSHVA